MAAEGGVVSADTVPALGKKAKETALPLCVPLGAG